MNSVTSDEILAIIDQMRRVSNHRPHHLLKLPLTLTTPFHISIGTKLRNVGLTVRILGGSSHTVNADSLDSIEMIKEKISIISHIPASMQRLLLKGKPMVNLFVILG
jgi:hypothetical protein